MALTESQKDRIRELSAQGLSNRAIAEQIGTNKDAVRRFLSQKHPEKCAKDIRNEITCARTSEITRDTTESGAKSAPRSAPKCATDKAIVDAMDDLVFIRMMCLEGLDRAKAETDRDKRVWMETQYLKLLKDAAIQVGKWQGKDKVAPDVSTVSPLDIFAEEVRRIEEAEGR